MSLIFRVAAFFDRDGEDMMRGHRLCTPVGACVIQAGAVLTSQLSKSVTSDVYNVARALGSKPGESFLDRGSAEGFASLRPGQPCAWCTSGSTGGRKTELFTNRGPRGQYVIQGVLSPIL